MTRCVSAFAVALTCVCHAVAEEPPPRTEADVVYGHKDGLALTMDVFRPDANPNGAVMVFVVSGGWYSHWAPPEQTRSWLQPYLHGGYTVMAVRHGSSPRYSIPDAVSDVRRAVRFIRHNSTRLRVDANRLGVLGMSAGGHLALMLGTTGDEGTPNAEDPLERVSSRVQAVVALVPPTDLRVAVWAAPESLPAYRNYPALNLPLEQAGEYSPVMHATADDAPALLMMGGKDELVPPRHGKWMEQALQKQGVSHRLVVFPDSGHGLDGEGTKSSVVREALDWFDRHLKTATE